MTAVDLVPLRARLVSLGRSHTPADVAAAMRAEGQVVTDATLLETVEALGRHSVGAGALNPASVSIILRFFVTPALSTRMLLPFLIPSVALETA